MNRYYQIIKERMGEKMKDLNEMRELRTVVSFLLENPDMAKLCHKIAIEGLEFFIHNCGNTVIRNGTINETELKNGKAATYLSDLIYTICMYIDDGNAISITENNPMYQNI